MQRTPLALLLVLSLPALAGPFSLIESRVAHVAAVERYELPAQPLVPYDGVGAAPFGGSFPLAVGSGLRFKGYEKGTSALEFWAVTDRGPNGDSPKVQLDGKMLPSKLFATPDFTPALARVRVSLAEKADVTGVQPLREGGKLISGRPLPPGQTGSTGELPLSDRLKPLAYDRHGLDTEGVDFDREGHLWLADEYGPFIVKVDAKSGEILKRYGPGEGLPEVLKARQPNRGFEGVAVTPSGKVVAIVQSTLDVDGKTKHLAGFTRIVELDPASGAVRQFAYPVSAHFKKAGDMKLGDIVALSDSRFALIEQGKDKNKQLRNEVVVIDLIGASDINGKTLADGRALEYGDAAMLAASAVTPVKKVPVLDLRALGWKPEKAEGLALVEGNQIALINDNDFGLAPSLTGSDADLDDLFLKDGMLHDKEGKPLNGARVAIKPNGEATELWLITLQKPLKDFL